MNGNIEVSPNLDSFCSNKAKKKNSKNFLFEINFQKLHQIYVQNVIDYMFLDDMLKSSEENIQSMARDALLWLKR